MEMQPVKSDTIATIGYDEQTHMLRVGFKHEKTREFCHVPEQTYKAFINARSKNRFYRRHIQNSFPC